MNKRGQMKLSFGMIFSIILIVIFLAFSVFAIQKFLEIQDAAQVSKFSSNLQEDIDKIWRGSQGSIEKEYTIPKGVTYVCFTDYSSGKKGKYIVVYDSLLQTYFEKENFFFYPLGSGLGLNSKEVKHIDLEKTTENENPFCIENLDNKLKLIIKKNFGEVLVTIEK
tara:strand:- start:981 stop:1478 length:498 start_codon:yes stop_codon:yes gene_type:complete